MAKVGFSGKYERTYLPKIRVRQQSMHFHLEVPRNSLLKSPSDSLSKPKWMMIVEVTAENKVALNKGNCQKVNMGTRNMR